jgi:RNA polymerase sigma-70 factor, ECF subfamily
MEGMSYDEAARVVGVPIGTIMSRVARGRDALRRGMMSAEPLLHSVGDGRTRHLRRVK